MALLVANCVRWRVLVLLIIVVELTGLTNSQLSREVFQRINQVRDEAGLPPLDWELSPPSIQHLDVSTPGWKINDDGFIVGNFLKQDLASLKACLEKFVDFFKQGAAKTGDIPEKTKVKKFQFVRKLGNGVQGAVYLGEHQDNPDYKIAMKVEAKQGKRKLVKEYGYYGLFGSYGGFPKTLFYEEITVGQGAEEQVYEVMGMELLDKNLQEIMNLFGGKLPIPDVLKLAPQFLMHLEFMHSKGLVYADAKPENTLLDVTGKIRVADFGVSEFFFDFSVKKHKENAPRERILTTPAFMTIESQDENAPQQTRKDDIEILANLLWFLGNGSMPWKSRKLNFVAKGEEIKNQTDEVEGCAEKVTLKQIQNIRRDALRGFPEVQTLIEMAWSMNYKQKPDYVEMRMKMHQSLKRLGLDFLEKSTYPELSKLLFDPELKSVWINCDESVSRASIVFFKYYVPAFYHIRTAGKKLKVLPETDMVLMQEASYLARYPSHIPTVQTKSKTKGSYTMVVITTDIEKVQTFETNIRVPDFAPMYQMTITAYDFAKQLLQGVVKEGKRKHISELSDSDSYLTFHLYLDKFMSLREVLEETFQKFKSVHQDQLKRREYSKFAYAVERGESTTVAVFLVRRYDWRAFKYIQDMRGPLFELSLRNFIRNPTQQPVRTGVFALAQLNSSSLEEIAYNLAAEIELLHLKNPDVFYVYFEWNEKLRTMKIFFEDYKETEIIKLINEERTKLHTEIANGSYSPFSMTLDLIPPRSSIILADQIAGKFARGEPLPAAVMNSVVFFCLNKAVPLKDLENNSLILLPKKNSLYYTGMTIIEKLSTARVTFGQHKVNNDEVLIVRVYEYLCDKPLAIVNAERSKEDKVPLEPHKNQNQTTPETCCRKRELRREDTLRETMVESFLQESSTMKEAICACLQTIFHKPKELNFGRLMKDMKNIHFYAEIVKDNYERIGENTRWYRIALTVDDINSEQIDFMNSHSKLQLDKKETPVAVLQAYGNLEEED